MKRRRKSATKNENLKIKDERRLSEVKRRRKSATKNENLKIKDERRLTEVKRRRKSATKNENLKIKSSVSIRIKLVNCYSSLRIKIAG